MTLKIPRLPIPTSMDSPEREYMRNLLKYQKAYVSLLSSGLNQILSELKDTSLEDMPEEMRMDSLLRNCQIPHFDANIEKSIRELFESVQNRLRKMYPDKVVKKWAQQMAVHVNDLSKKNTEKVGDAVGLQIESLMRDGELTPYFQNVVDENIGLIRSIPLEKMEAFKNTLVYAITNDSHNSNFHQQIEKYISKNVANTKSRARLIARDQVNKLNGRLNQYRQQKLGGVKYIWATSKDERVRKDHAKLEGTTQSWDKPPVVDKATGRRAHPGLDFNCRCTAIMDMEDVLSEKYQR